MSTPTQAEADIRSLMEGRVNAVLAKDAGALVANHSPDVVVYDLLEPLHYKGVADVKRRAQQWFDGYDGPMEYELRDLEIVAGHGVAFCYGLHRVRGTTKHGHKIDMYWRATQGLRWIDGKWLIVHEHSSVPFDMATGKVSFSLKP